VIARRVVRHVVERRPQERQLVVEPGVGVVLERGRLQPDVPDQRVPPGSLASCWLTRPTTIASQISLSARLVRPRLAKTCRPSSYTRTEGAYASALGTKPGIGRWFISWWRAELATAKSKKTVRA